MKNKLLLALIQGILLTLILLTLAFQLAQAQEVVCTTVYYPTPPPGQFVLVCEGEGGGGDEIPPPPGDCVPGTNAVITSYVPAYDDICEVNTLIIDACTGDILIGWLAGFAPCPDAPPGEGTNPCSDFIITPGGLTCWTEWGLDWQLTAGVNFPETYLDLRPYPATLVRWPSAARNGGQPPASGSGSLDYIAYGDGEPGSPELGDWRNVRLTLQLWPAGPLIFTLPQQGALVLPDVGPNGPIVILQWERPSHPAAGGGPLAGAIAGLSELPPDLPVFAGAAQSPYRLFWRLTYQRYRRRCESGPDPDTGVYECETGSDLGYDDGHWEYSWQNRIRRGEITPQTVVGLPPELAADANGDGVPEAYWNRNVTVRRMDEGGQVNNPAWAASWNWGGAVYWAVREGQGQIGRPGGP